MADVRVIELTKDQFTLVDTDDYEMLIQWNWYADRNRPTAKWYAARRLTDGKKKDGRIVRMHRIIMGEPEGFEIDHANGDGLDNRKSNLRLANASQNRANRKSIGTSKYLGVSWNKRHTKWEVSCRHKETRIRGGLFSDEIEAALAYDKMATQLHGEFANLNFPIRCAVPR